MMLSLLRALIWNIVSHRPFYLVTDRRLIGSNKMKSIYRRSCTPYVVG